MSTTAPPSDVELDETDQLLDQLAAGRSDGSSPAVLLLRTAAGPTTGSELADPTDVIGTIASGPERARGPWAVLAGRTVAAKVAIVAAVATLGVAGAGAATGLVVEFGAKTPSTTVPTPTPSDRVQEPSAGGSETSVAPQSSQDATDQLPDRDAAVGPLGEEPEPEADARTGDEDPSDVDDLVSPDAFGNPTPGSHGATNGNAPSAGGNPTPGSQGATNGNSPNAGGNPTPGSQGATNGNSPNAGGNPTPVGPNAGGNPTPGSQGATNGNSPNAGGNPTPVGPNAGSNPAPRTDTGRAR